VDLGKIAFVEERELKAAGAHQLAELVDSSGPCGRIAGVSLEYLDGHRASVTVAHQAEVDLRRATLAIARVAKSGQSTGMPLVPGGAQVVENQSTVLQLALRQSLFDLLLPGRQPVHRCVNVVFVDCLEVEHPSERGPQRVLAQSANGGQLGAWVQDTGDDKRLDDVAYAASGTIEHAMQVQDDGGDVPVGAASRDLESIHGVAASGHPLEHGTKTSHLFQASGCAYM